MSDPEKLSKFDNITFEYNNNDVNDELIAFLTDKYGDKCTSDEIFNVCNEHRWQVDDCIESLENLDLGIMFKQKKKKKSNPSPLVQDGLPSKNENQVDMVIESEEIQNNISNNSKNSNELNQSDQWNYAGVIKKTNRHPANSTNDLLQEVNIRYSDRPNLREISATILQGFKVMVIMRGPPGCGKTYLAREMINATISKGDYAKHIFSTDDYFYDRRGYYNFNTFLLSDAHTWNKNRVEQAAAEGWSPIIVDNTNIKVWEMNYYVEIAVKNGYLIEIIEPNTAWSRSASKLATKNSHNVPKESIERMISSYEFTTVKHAMHTMSLKYTVAMPQYRLKPPIDFKCIDPISTPSDEHFTAVNEFASKPQRTQKILSRLNHESVSRKRDVEQYESVEEAFQHVRKDNNEWTAFETERKTFWNTPTLLPELSIKRNHVQNTDVMSTETKDKLHSNLFSILKEKVEDTADGDVVDGDEASMDENEDRENVLHKHSKHCKNENNSFSQIRQIYPSVPVEFLWDLFEKCNGNGDWTMDILLKEETRIGDYEKLYSDEDKARDDFYCDCELNELDTFSPTLENSYLKPLLNVQPNSSTSQRSRRAINSEEHLITKRMIEENFKIGDEYYSKHTRKIRNIRHGLPSPTSPVQTSAIEELDGACGGDIDELDQNDEEILEIILGMDLVCQLDSVFGVQAYQKEVLKDMKTNVFMPKSLAQQLYALWMESMYNQLEEQRKGSIKEDAEFARQLQSQLNYPVFHKYEKPPTDLKDIMEMEYAWAAYKTEMHAWQSQTPQDLALQMTHDKLCSLFPNVQRDTLVKVLTLHDNKFAETVDVLKKTLQKNVAVKIEKESHQLFEKVKVEVETTKSNDLKVIRSTSDRSLENKKLGPDEAKREALKEFENCRNVAMRHTQLKIECYNKAKEAIQRGDTSVAVYYSQVANLHKTRIDEYNNKAANYMSEAHKLIQNNADMLDLHYLHVNEAAECLDIFLDKHITKLKTMPQTYKYIFIITGRGLHSANGVSRIKQRVKSRFRERFLSWSEVNPGLLKVKIFSNSRLTLHL